MSIFAAIRTSIPVGFAVGWLKVAGNETSVARPARLVFKKSASKFPSRSVQV